MNNIKQKIRVDLVTTVLSVICPYPERRSITGQNLPPILDSVCPFAKHVLSNKVEHRKQSIVGREDAFTLGDFAQLAMVAFSNIGCIDDLTNFWRILEKGRYFCPVIAPGSYNEWVFFSPYFFKAIQFFCSGQFRRSCINRLLMRR